MRYLLFLSIALLHVAAALAQPRERTHFPKAILVQLSSEHNRMTGLQKLGTKDELKQLRQDAAEVSKRMRMDFRDNFTLYPVYFFADTNLESVKQGRLKDILTDIDGDAVTQPEIGSGFEYFIVYYGYPTLVGRHHTKHLAADKAESKTFDTHLGKYLVVCNRKMEQLTYVHQRQPRMLRDVSPEDKKYFYNSPKFDVGYHALAKKLPDVLAGLPLNYE